MHSHFHLSPFFYLWPYFPPYCTPHRTNMNIDPVRSLACVPVNSDVERISSWGFNTPVAFNVFKTSFLSTPLKRHPSPSRHMLFDWSILSSIDPVSLLGSPISSSLYWASISGFDSGAASSRSSFLPLWNTLPISALPPTYNLSLSKNRINNLSITRMFSTLSPLQYVFWLCG